jgi:hypothetical protein
MSRLSIPNMSNTRPKLPMSPVKAPDNKSAAPGSGFSIPSNLTIFETTYPNTKGIQSIKRYPRLRVDSINIRLFNSDGRPTKQMKT